MDTIDLSTKAHEYASGKVDAILTKAVEQAYKDGYHDGFNEGRSVATADLCDEEDGFVDLGLPSGTLWSEDYLSENGDVLYWTYGEAEHESLPTIEQWRELQDICVWRYYRNNNTSMAKCIGPNGNALDFKVTGRMIADELLLANAFFWISSDEISPNNRITAAIRFYKNGTGDATHESCFVGYRLPVRAVKKHG